MSKIMKTGQPIMATAVAMPPTPVTQKPNTPPAAHKIVKRIGGTTYHVTRHFSKTSKETINDKITRIIQRETSIGKAAGQ